MAEIEVKKNHDRYYIPILVTALIIAAFVIGSLRTKGQYLKIMASKATGTAAQAQPIAQPNPQPAQLAAATSKPAGKPKEVTDKDHIRGNKNAKVTLIEYSDLECPFCKRFHPTMQEIMKTYGNDVRWVYRHYPLDFHQNAQKEDEAAECVNQLAGNDKFFEYIDKIFERTTSNGTGFALDKLGPLAAEVGVDQAAFQACLDSGKYAQHVKDDMAEGTAAGVTGTPGTFVVDAKGNAQLVEGAQPAAAVKTIIDQVLKQ